MVSNFLNYRILPGCTSWTFFPLILFALLGLPKAKGQLFERHFDYGRIDQESWKGITDIQNNQLYIVDKTDGIGSNDYRNILLRVNQFGDIERFRDFHTKMYIEEMHSVNESTLYAVWHDGTNVLAFLMDSDLNVLDTVTVATFDSGGYQYLRCASVSDNYLYVVYSTYDPSKKRGYEHWSTIVKINEMNEVVWKKEKVYQTGTDLLRIIIGNNNIIYVFGRVYNKNSGIHNFYLLGMDSNGNELIDEEYIMPGEQLDYYSHYIGRDDNMAHLFLMGRVEKSDGYNYPFYIKITDSGEIVKSKVFDNRGSTSSFFVDDASNLYIAGYVFSNNSARLSLTKLDKDGNEVFTRIFRPDLGGYLRNIVADEENGFLYLYGVYDIRDTAGSLLNRNVILIKTDLEGTPPPVGVDYVTLSDKDPYALFPNPAGSQVEFLSNNADMELAWLQINDLSGKLIGLFAPQSMNKFVLDKNMASGIYLGTPITTQGQFLAPLRLVINKGQ